jgi:nicotinate-nucleotide adenylyltransferase
MKIGLFGGTFDPVHFGHLIIAETIRNDMELDRLILLPAAVPPHKQDQQITAFHHRVAMLNLAIEDDPEFSVSEFEFNKGISYTIDTIQYFKSTFPDDSFYLIIGADSLFELDTWKDPDRLLNSVPVIVARRTGYPFNKVTRKWRKRCQWIDTPCIELSSSDIRSRVSAKQSIRFRVPRPVEKYIIQNGLYLC